MDKNLIDKPVYSDNTKLIRGGNGYCPSQFELKLQLHGEVSNPYSFKVTGNYKVSANINIEFTSQTWTTSGTYTWIAPFTGTVTVVVIGGGGGEGAKAKGFAGSVGGSAGGTSQFKLGTNILLQATGGGGGVGRMLEYDTPTDNSSGGSGGSPNGVAGSVSRSGSIFSASAQITTRVGHGWQLSTSMISGSYGQGGSSNTTTSSWKAGCGPGGGGGYNKLSLEIIHGNSYTIVVGSGGAGRGDRTSAKNGSSGAVGIWKE